MSNFKFLVLSALLLVPMLSEASIVNLGTVTTSTSFASAGPLYNAFNDEYDFTTNGANSVGVSATNVAINVGSATFGSIWSFSANLDGQSLAYSNSITPVGSINFIFQLLSGGLTTTATTNHVLHITGYGLGGSYGGNVSVVPTAVPVPAAMWMLLTGLIGTLGLNRRKSAMETV